MREVGRQGRFVEQMGRVDDKMKFEVSCIVTFCLVTDLLSIPVGDHDGTLLVNFLLLQYTALSFLLLIMPPLHVMSSSRRNSSQTSNGTLLQGFTPE